MISHGISAPSTTPFCKAGGSSGTGIATGDAPSASITQAPVRVGILSFLPARSPGDLTESVRIWMAWPA